MQFFRPINHVDAMTFDLDDTLYDNEPIIRQAEQALQAHMAKHHKKAAPLKRSESNSDCKNQLLYQSPDHFSFQPHTILTVFLPNILGLINIVTS